MRQKHSEAAKRIVFNPYSILRYTLVFIGLCVVHIYMFAQDKPSYSIPSVGDSAPDFSIDDFKGKKFTLAKITENKGVVLWFTNLCSGCQSEIPTMNKLKTLFEKKGIEIVGVSVLGEDRKKVQDVMKKKKISFRFLYDPTGSATQRFSGKYVEGTCPLKNIFIIGKGGMISFAGHLPGVEIDELTDMLNKITEGIQQ